MEPSTKTVLSARRRRHLDRLRDFCADLQRSVNTVFPTGASQFGHVAVMGITWENDKMGCKAAEQNLFAVLRKQYGFWCNGMNLSPNSQSPAQDLHNAISTFHKGHDADDALLIYIYSGHASSSWNGGMEWSGDLDANRNLLQPTVDWVKVRGHTEACRARVLYIFDTCYAGAGGVHDGPEILGAAGWASQASPSHTYSFTKVLTDHLVSLKGKPHSVSQIYTDLCRNVVNPQLNTHPVHFHQRGKDSIALEPTQTASNAFGTQSASARSAALQEMGPPRDKVLISVHLRGEVSSPDLEQWERWLKSNLPRMVSHVTIEAMYVSSSTILHASMLLEVWDGLPHDQPAYNFLSFIKSGNTLPNRNLPAFPLADRTKKEDLPFGESSRQGSKRQG